MAIAWLAAASLFFYALWNPSYLVLLIFSIIFNYCVGSALAQRSKKNINQKLLLILGIAFNLALIVYFKYTNFLASVSNDLLGTVFTLNKIILPIGISFFTFQQIAWFLAWSWLDVYLFGQINQYGDQVDNLEKDRTKEQSNAVDKGTPRKIGGYITSTLLIEI